MQDYVIDSFYERYIFKNLYPAVEKTLTKGTQYSCALLLFSYTEMVGSHITGNCTQRYKGRENFEAFLKYMGQPYCDLLENFPNVNFYDLLRNGLAHEMEPKCQYVLVLTEQPDAVKIGINCFDNARIVNVNLQEYFRDFKSGMDKLYKELKSWQKNAEVFSNFINCRRQKYDKYRIKEEELGPE